MSTLTAISCARPFFQAVAAHLQKLKPILPLPATEDRAQPVLQLADGAEQHAPQHDFLLPQALRPAATPLVDFFSGILSNNNSGDLEQLDTALAAALDVGALICEPVAKIIASSSSATCSAASSSSAASPAAAALLATPTDGLVAPSVPAMSPQLAFLLKAIQTVCANNNSSNNNTNNMTTAATIVGRLLRAAHRVESTLSVQALFTAVGAPEVAVDTSSKRNRRMAVLSRARIVFPVSSSLHIEEAGLAASLYAEFINGFAAAAASASAAASSSSLRQQNNYKIDSALISAVAQAGLHPGFVVDTFVEAAFQLAEAARQHRSDNIGSELMMDVDLFRDLAALKPAASSATGSSTNFLSQVLLSDTATSLGIAHYVSVVSARLRDLSAAAADTTSLALESHKAVFGIALLYQQLSGQSPSPSSILSLDTALAYLVLVCDNTDIPPGSDRCFSSKAAHAALASATHGMSAHAASAFTEIVVDKKSAVEVPGQVEVVARGSYLLTYPVPRPALVSADVTTTTTTTGGGAQHGVLPPVAVTQQSGFVGTVSVVQQQQQQNRNQQQQQQPVVMVYGPPTVATFVTWLLRFGEADTARECIVRGLKGKLPAKLIRGNNTNSSANRVSEDAALASVAAAAAAAAAAGPLLPTPTPTTSVTSNTAPAATAPASAAATTSTKLEMNLFLAPCALSTPTCSVTDAVASFLLAHLVGAAELERESDSSSTGGQTILMFLQKVQHLDQRWRKSCWPLLRLARSHVAGYLPVLLHSLIFLRCVHVTLNRLRDQHQQQQQVPLLQQVSSHWIQHTADFFSGFLAPCMLVLPPVPAISSAVSDVLDSLLRRVDQRTVVDALPSSAQQYAAANAAVLLEDTDASSNNETTTNNNDGSSSSSSGNNNAAPAPTLIVYPAERIALLRHNAILSYCMSRLTEKDVKEFSALISPVLNANPKLVLERLLQRAIAYPSADLQLTNALLLRDAPPVVFLLLPVMAVEKMHGAVSADLGTAEQRVSAIATLVTLAWRHSWDSFATGHVFDAIETALGDPTRASLLFALPLLKSMLALILLRKCESDITYGAPHLIALRGGPLLRWWTAGAAEAMQQRWLPGLFTPAALEDVWARFERAMSTKDVGLRLLWGLLQTMQAINDIYQDARGSAEGNTLRSLVDTDTVRDMCGILVDVLLHQTNPRSLLRQQLDLANSSVAAHKDGALSLAAASPVSSFHATTMTTTQQQRVASVLSLQSLAMIAPRAFALLNSVQRAQARNVLLIQPQQGSSSTQAAEEHSLLMKMMICFGSSNNNNNNNNNSDHEGGNNNRFLDPLFGVVLQENNNNAPEPVNSAVASELEFYAVFWMLDLCDIAPLTETEFALQQADAKSRIAAFTTRAEKNSGATTTSSTNNSSSSGLTAAQKRARAKEFNPGSNEESIKTEQLQLVLPMHNNAMALLKRVVLRNKAVLLFASGDNGSFFADRFLTCCLLPRAVSSMPNALAVAAFIERLFYLNIEEEEEGSEDKSHQQEQQKSSSLLSAQEGNGSGSGGGDKNNNKNNSSSSCGGVSSSSSSSSSSPALQLLAVTLACNYVRLYCSMLASFSPDEAKRGVVCLSRLFWFAARNVTTDTLVDLSAFVTQSIFGVLFVKKACASAEGLDRGSDGNTVPEFIQRTALNIIDALRVGPPQRCDEKALYFSNGGETDEYKGNRYDAAPTPTTTALFPVTVVECRVLVPAVAVHARSSSPLYATATKLFHALKQRCAQQHHHQSHVDDTQAGKAVDDNAMETVLASAISALLRVGGSNNKDAEDAFAQRSTTAKAPTTTAAQQRQQRQTDNNRLDDSYEAAMRLLLKNERAQVAEAEATQAGLAVGEDDAEPKEEEEDENDDDAGVEGENESREGGDDDDNNNNNKGTTATDETMTSAGKKKKKTNNSRRSNSGANRSRSNSRSSSSRRSGSAASSRASSNNNDNKSSVSSASSRASSSASRRSGKDDDSRVREE